MPSCVITIAREHGSGGRQIGKILAELLGIPFYDHALIALSAKESGYSEEFVANLEDKRTNSFLYDSFMAVGSLPPADQLFIAQSNIIRELAKTPCVIVGRCADYVLRERPNCLNVFLYAPLAARLARLRKVHGDGPEATEAQIRKIDRQRAAYYAHNTQRDWSHAQNYDLCLNSELGLTVCAKLIALAAENKNGSKTLHENQ